ncbi:unnamed protein product [Brugia pahangi]|uniref:Uncharacterized protein n=1 Tax=Brugia pahangi TaxID=6280 RepID=A0A0N4TKY4_BRUPA|nr:unnamed protein product [Brugia pahangi]
MEKEELKEVNEERKEETGSKTEGEADNDSDDCIIASVDKGNKVQKKNLQENEAYFNQS